MPDAVHAAALPGILAGLDVDLVHATACWAR